LLRPPSRRKLPRRFLRPARRHRVPAGVRRRTAFPSAYHYGITNRKDRTIKEDNIVKLTGVEKQEKSMVALSVTVDKDEFEKACEKAYHQNVKKMNVPGFRKGKAPRKMIET